MKNFLSILLFFISLNSILSQDTIVHHVLFDSDADQINEQELEQLTKVIQSAKNNQLLAIFLAGHTDSDGNHDYNLALSQRRVKSVEDYLKLSYQLDSKTKFHGKKKPLNNNASEKEKEKNRRVEVTIIIEKQIEEAPNDEYTLKDLYADLSLAYQTLCIDPNKDTIVKLAQGTLLNIRAGTFSSQDSCIQIKAKEVYTYSDMFFENLSTISDGRQLESGGMIYLEASDQKGNFLSPSESISVFMPTNEFKNDMRVFYGERDAHDNLNWKLEDRTESNRMVGFSFGRIGPLIPPIDLNENCKFFWCKVRIALRTVGGVFSKELRYANIAEKNRYKRSEEIQELMDSLGVSNYAELYEYMQKERMKQIEEKAETGKANIQDLSYYAFSTSKLGWINCDRFQNADPKITMETPIARFEGIDVKLYFKSIKSIMPPNSGGVKLAFRAIKGGEKINYVAVKTTQGKIYLSMIETTTTENAPELNFEVVTLEELKRKIQRLNS